jgi:hypothetical protein
VAFAELQNHALIVVGVSGAGEQELARPLAFAWILRGELEGQRVLV